MKILNEKHYQKIGITEWRMTVTERSKWYGHLLKLPDNTATKKDWEKQKVRK